MKFVKLFKDFILIIIKTNFIINFIAFNLSLFCLLSNIIWGLKIKREDYLSLLFLLIALNISQALFL